LSVAGPCEARARTKHAHLPTRMFLQPAGAAYTLTFGDRAENETGMQIIGTSAQHGISVRKLKELQEDLRRQDIESFIVDLAKSELAEDAAVLVIRGGVNSLLGPEAAKAMLRELESMPKDSTTLMYGKVVKKHARHNNCIADYSQPPDIRTGRGTIVSFKDYPITKQLRDRFCELLDQPTLVGELNHYFDSNTCGIGWHGDSERKIVVGVRLGRGADQFPLKFQWYRHGAPVGQEQRITLNASDIYISSEKAVGTDWKRSSIPTLRHAAGKDTCKYSQSRSQAKKRARED